MVKKMCSLLSFYCSFELSYLESLGGLSKIVLISQGLWKLNHISFNEINFLRIKENRRWAMLCVMIGTNCLLMLPSRKL